MQRARAGDEEAFAWLVRLAAPTALAAARRITGDRELAEDAAQEAFLRAFRALSEYRHGPSFSAWVRTIATRVAIDFVRRRRPEGPLSPSLPGARREEETHEENDLLREALRHLSPLDREILLLREVEGERDVEIARRLGMTVTAVRVRMHRARRRLRKIFGEKA